MNGETRSTFGVDQNVMVDLSVSVHVALFVRTSGWCHREHEVSISHAEQSCFAACVRVVCILIYDSQTYHNGRQPPGNIDPR